LVSIKELIQLILQDAQTKALVAEVTIQAKLPVSLPRVRCDRQKIGWVIGELVNNAIKFTPKGGQVYVEAEGVDNKVNIAVSDTGIGIPGERQLEIFEPFHQLDGSSTRRYGGTGLGLALVNRIITAHGARIQVRSKVGKGARFEFSLPAEPVAKNQKE
jgi:signal transduction histidine kinase